MSGADIIGAPGARSGERHWAATAGTAGYRAEIDGLRAVAVLPVILFHAGFGTFGGGFVGVDVFFVISGYLITGILLKEMEEERFSLLRFYERRARRILPALFLVMAACLPFAWAWMLPSEFEDFSLSVLWTSLFGSNFFFWLTSGYFDLVAEEKPLLHTWSLAVEEQFYLGFPLFFLVAMRFFGRSVAFWSVVAIAVGSLALAEVASRLRPEAAFYLLPTRAWELMAGALCAFHLHRNGRRSNGALAWAGLGLILLAVFLFDETRTPSLSTLVPVGGAVLIILFAGGGTGAGRLLASRALVGIGLISYSAYLWHQPLFAFARIRLETTPGPPLMLALSAAALGLAYLSWRFVEQPFRRYPRPVLVTRSRVFAASALGATAFIGFGAWGHLGEGLDWRFRLNPLQREYVATALPFPLRDECTTSGSDYREPAEACVYFHDRAEVAVFGDSHADELAYAIAEELEPRGLGIVHLTRGACSPRYWRAEETLCGQWTRAALDHVRDSAEIDTVIVSYRILYDLFGAHRGAYPGLPDERSPEERESILAALTDLLESFRAAGKRVILVLQSPELPRSIEELAMQHKARGEPIAGVTRDWWEARNRYLRRELEVPDGVTVVDTTDLFCDEVQCYAGEDGVSWYYDDNHVSMTGARFVAERVVGLLADDLPSPGL
ncbi:MAG TPA: acyltransferase family protein [Gemmatimonadales bacterium]|nr:acyltransferase family protein [Gemmatimonadales bacterium]